MGEPEPGKVQREIGRELSAGERLHWSGIPVQGLIFRSSDAFEIPFGIFWTSFIVYWEYSVVESRSVFMIVWGIPFMAIGAHLLIGRFLVDIWVRRRTYYGVTDQRVIIARRGLQGTVTSIDYADMSEISLLESSRDRGTIRFGPEPEGWLNSGRASWPLKPPRFEGIENARGVYEQIRQLRRSN